MMAARRQMLWLFPLLAVALFLAGCPKAPSTTQTGAIAPIAPGRGEWAPMASARGGSASASTVPVPYGAPAGASAFKDFAARGALQDIHFGFDRYKIRPADAVILDKNARWLRDNPDSVVLIEGHADERGTNEYNLALGERRAKATMDYLIAQGLEPSRFITLSYGEENPVCIEKTEGCWGENRRAGFLVKRS